MRLTPGASARADRPAGDSPTGCARPFPCQSAACPCLLPVFQCSNDMRCQQNQQDGGKGQVDAQPAVQPAMQTGLQVELPAVLAPVLQSIDDLPAVRTGAAAQFLEP